MMKKKIKVVNKNLILIFVVIICLLLFAFTFLSLFHEAESIIQELNDSAKTSMKDIMSKDEIGDVEGYGLILSAIGYSFGGLSYIALGILEIILVVYPIFLAICLFLFSIIARIVYSPSKGRLLAYRILMGFVYAVLVLIGIHIFGFIIAVDFCLFSFIFIILEIILLFILGINIRNTYTDRIKRID